jgi:molybdopterin-dependent oxidoreductase alpha subunit
MRDHDLPEEVHHKPLINTPPETAAPAIETPKEKAAGFPGVFHALEDAISEMGVARSVHTLSKLNQRGGFDCPSCAWPDPDDRRSLTEFCENGAKAVADEATRKHLGPDFFARHSIEELSHWSDFELGKAGRFTQPLVKRACSTHYEEISWDEAFSLIARELNALASPNEASFYTSGRTSNEAAFLYQLFARIYGTNNLPDCSNMCHESSGYGLGESLGVGKGTVKVEDLEHADVILIVGQNPGTNHPRMLTTLQRAVRNGAKIIAINPLREAGLTAFMNPQEVGGMLGFATPLASLHLPVRVNGDVALVKGLVKEMHELGIGVNRDFIAEHTIGFDEFLADVIATSWHDITGESGITREEIRAAATMIANAGSVIACWAMGLTQHKNGVANIQMIANLLLLGGNFGRRGAGACPVRGHSNVQGDRTMGIFDKMPEWFHAALDREFGFRSPREHGLDAVGTIEAMRDGRVKVFVGLGGNFLAATPDTAAVAQGLRRCRLTVQISTKPNRSHLVTGELALVLPCLGRTERDESGGVEQFVTVENSMGVVHASKGNLRPGSEHLRSEPAIIAGLAKALFRGTAKERIADWASFEANYDRIRDRIERVVPGFERFNERVRAGEFYLPNAVRDELKFNNPEKKARFIVHPIARTRPPAGRFVMTTIRSHDQFNTTIYGLNDRYRGVKHGRRVILMNPDDMRAAGLAAGEAVDLTSHHKGVERFSPRFFVVPYQIPRQCVATYYPEANSLVPLESFAEGSRTPSYKSVEISLRRST